MIFSKVKSLKGEITVPGDKSISHRSIMLGSLAKGTTEVHNFLFGADCLSSINCFKEMGVNIENHNDIVTIHGLGIDGLKKPKKILNVGNSGTTTRLMSGILAAQPFRSVIDGDDSIRRRPMDRIINPLTSMGSVINSKEGNGCTPLVIDGTNLHGIDYISPFSSAQVKSSILLAGLFAEGKTSVTEPFLSRNHTELMFESFGVNINTINTTSTVTPCKNLIGQKIVIPGDISSAAYFIVAGLITPNSCITIKNVGINPTRAGIIKVCELMGANISLSNVYNESGESYADITVSTSSLKGITIGDEIIPTLIDELPIIALLACFANGTTTIKDASELKVKESNRIDVMVTNLSKLGASIVATDDGMVINGGNQLNGSIIDSNLDHRIAMTFAIAGLNSEGTTTVSNFECVDISYPSFYENLSSLFQ